MTDEDLVGRRVGHIRVERFLAGGGMGSVYVGFDETLERRVALKAIRSRSRLDPESRARFLREARVLSRLRHPHICQIHDYVESEGRDFLVLELVEGRGLDAALEGSSAACRRLLAREASSPRIRGLLASTLVELGRLRERGGDPHAARACWEDALEAVAGIAGNGGAIPFRNARAKALLFLGRVDEARPVVAALVATGWSDPDLLALGRARGLPVRPGS